MPSITATTSIPPNELYRYHWNVELGSPGRGQVLFIMKNPSWPDEGNHTFGRAEAWARHRGFSSMSVANLFPRRSFAPRDLNAFTYEEAARPLENDYETHLLAEEADLVVAAWGQRSRVRRDYFQQRVHEVVRLVGSDRFACVRHTGGGHPWHPQTLSVDWDPVDWRLSDVTSW